MKTKTLEMSHPDKHEALNDNTVEVKVETAFSTTGPAPESTIPAEILAKTKKTLGKTKTPHKGVGHHQEVEPESLFFSRDESWLRFNERVLQEAQDELNPLLERVKFLAITASNLDEFVEIRVAGILQRIEDGFNQASAPDEDGLTPEQRLERLSVSMAEFVSAQYECWNEQLLPSLKKAGVRMLGWGDLSKEARQHAEQFYTNEVDPLLTPVTIDPSHPFPRVLNKALCIALLLRHKRRTPTGSKSPRVLGVVTVPRSLPRLVSLPSEAGHIDYIFLHELIEAKVEKMYRGLRGSGHGGVPRHAQQQSVYAGRRVAQRA